MKDSSFGMSQNGWRLQSWAGNGRTFRRCPPLAAEAIDHHSSGRPGHESMLHYGLGGSVDVLLERRLADVVQADGV